MKVLLITDSYPPEIRSASHLMLELSEGLRDKGFEVTVATTYPEYNLANEQRNKKYPEFTEENQIKVIRIKTLPHHKVNFIIRGISQISMPYIFESKIKKYLKKVDIIIVYSPPLPLAMLGTKLKKIFNAKFFLNVQDIFPQNAIDLGVLKNPLLIKFFKYMERNAYINSDLIFVHSEGNSYFLKKNHPDIATKFIVLHNWIDTKQFEGLSRTNKYRKLYDIEDKFIILFAGVIGPSQGLDFVIELAEKLQDLKDLVFLFVGDGMEKTKLQDLARAKNLNNVIFKPFVSKDEYPYLVKDCDVGLVSLSSKNKTPVVPGKILGYMAAKLPVLAFLNRESDGHSIIKNADCGLSCIHGDIHAAEKLVREIYRNKISLSTYGENGYKYLVNNFEREICIQKLIENF
ncbi:MULTISPECIES: glycosyltransferase family 4 protein [Thermodesulfovibrio]|jgi:glycosyltransferase involved in cell wall biosynthesis|uniref:glycosyltransferase family 4 protein n=1 Tax=Thermodesulfovibrio TaxID=28261 RepID=UPI00262E3BA3|nr:glycosyltransferase family 4 protein [Thermodesulfovibrio sp.]